MKIFVSRSSLLGVKRRKSIKSQIHGGRNQTLQGPGKTRQKGLQNTSGPMLRILLAFIAFFASRVKWLPPEEKKRRAAAVSC